MNLRSGGSVPPDRINKLSVPIDWSLTPAAEIDHAFGGGFAKTLSELPVNTWSGPVNSGLGLHLVRVIESRPERHAPFDEVRDLVARQYAYYTVLEAQKRMFKELLDKYRVRISAAGVPEQILQKYSQP
ncbi:MAG: peptidyl-prolyl cis-trans isomerase [Hyphomicrobium sp.]